MSEKKKFRQDRKLWFRGFKNLIRLRYRKPRFVFLGAKPTSQSLVLTNHYGARVPLTLELYADFPIRYWGTYEMNSGLRSTYRYLVNTYYVGKKGWNIHLARLFCLLAAPLTNLFYRGLRLISTYRDYRFRKSIAESLEVLNEDDNIVIFPENSEEGYFDELKEFYPGFVLLCERALRRGIDLPIFVSYLRPRDNTYLFEEPIFFSELKKMHSNKKDMAKYLLDKTNALGVTDVKDLK
ncbi:MAG: hypothetical protein ACOX56_00975 [Acholeplasmataceae bacterium]|jgi:hypothetical protein